MINYEKLLNIIESKGITTYEIRKNGFIPQGTYTKFKISSGKNMDEVKEKLDAYKTKHDGKDLSYDVSTKTIEELCQLFQCQPMDLIEWEVELKPELSYENIYGKSV